MENIERGWQATTRKVRNRLMHVLQSPDEFLADVHFNVGRPGEEQEKIGAHKLILAAGSEVLYAMLFGPVAEKGSCIEITDLHPKAFRQMLRFLYTDRIEFPESESDELDDNLSLEFRTMECARKYDIPELFFACRQQLLDWVRLKEHYRDDDSTRYTVRDEALEFGDRSLAEACNLQVFGCGCCGLRHVNVELLSHYVLCKFLSQRDTYCEDKFQLANRWVQFHCGEKATPEEVRDKLGEARFLIRYFELSPTEISNGPVKSGFLTLEEQKQVFELHFKWWDSTLKKDEEHPFDGRLRKKYYDELACGGTFPLMVNNEDGSFSDDALFKLVLKEHPEAPPETYQKFQRLYTLDYPFPFYIGATRLDPTPEGDSYGELSKRKRKAAIPKQKLILQTLMPEESVSNAKYLMEGDVAMSFDEETKEPVLNVAVTSEFLPSGWIPMARIHGYVSQTAGSVSTSRNFVKALGKLKTIQPRIEVYFQPEGEPYDQDDEEDDN